MNILQICIQGSSHELGTGHIERGASISDAILKSSHHKLSVISNSERFKNLKKLKSYQLTSILEIKKKLSDSTFLNQFDILIFDALDVFSDCYKFIKDLNILILGIDVSRNLSKVDIKINPSIESSKVFLKGLNYSIVNPKTKNLVKKQKKELFICFGGYDYRKHLLKFMKIILKEKLSYKINLVCSTKEDFKKFKNLNLPSLVLHYRPKHFYNLLNSANVAVISGGILLQEAVFLGIPSIVVPQYKHQKKIGKKIRKDGGCWKVKNISLDYKELLNDIKDLSISKKVLDNISYASKSKNDGFGSERIVNILEIYQTLKWDSDYFGFSIGQITSKYLNDSILSKIKSFDGYKSNKLTYFLAQSDDKQTLNFAKKHGFLEVDRRITFSLSRNNYIPLKNLPKGLKMRKAKLKDNLELSNLAHEAEWHTRYYKDPNFPKTKLKDFYKLWIQKSISGKLDDLVLIASYKGEIAGFISIKIHGMNSSSIGLISVSKKYRGMKFGNHLIDFAANYVFSKGISLLDVVTQNDNQAAKKIYEKGNFIISNDQTWFHKWK